MFLFQDIILDKGINKIEDLSKVEELEWKASNDFGRNTIIVNERLNLRINTTKTNPESIKLKRITDPTDKSLGIVSGYEIEDAKIVTDPRTMVMRLMSNIDNDKENFAILSYASGKVKPINFYLPADKDAENDKKSRIIATYNLHKTYVEKVNQEHGLDLIPFETAVIRFNMDAFPRNIYANNGVYNITMPEDDNDETDYKGSRVFPLISITFHDLVNDNYFTHTLIAREETWVDNSTGESKIVVIPATIEEEIVNPLRVYELMTDKRRMNNLRISNYEGKPVTNTFLVNDEIPDIDKTLKEKFGDLEGLTIIKIPQNILKSGKDNRLDVSDDVKAFLTHQITEKKIKALTLVGLNVPVLDFTRTYRVFYLFSYDAEKNITKCLKSN